MSEKIFRQAALERLSAPERLDDSIEVTSPRLWLALVATSVILLAAGGWGVAGSVPTQVQGQGLLIRDGSLQTVDAPDSGQVRELLVRAGDDVERDQLVARLVQAGDNRSIVVISPYAGRVLEVRVTEGNYIAGGTALLSLEQPGRPLEAVLYLAPADAKKVEPGMAVQVSPASVKREEYGLLLGRVTAVGAFPTTLAGMRRLLGSEELARSLSASGPPVEVRVELERNAATYSGYQWTSTQGSLADTLAAWLPVDWAAPLEPAPGPPIRLQSGTPCTANVITDEQAPIFLALARFER
jgi:multidrug efflux pump subunit AcrA (membrane-fusion protein)